MQQTDTTDLQWTDAMTTAGLAGEIPHHHHLRLLDLQVDEAALVADRRLLAEQVQ
jgi:hypothetical protein